MLLVKSTKRCRPASILPQGRCGARRPSVIYLLPRSQRLHAAMASAAPLDGLACVDTLDLTALGCLLRRASNSAATVRWETRAPHILEAHEELLHRFGRNRNYSVFGFREQRERHSTQLVTTTATDRQDHASRLVLRARDSKRDNTNHRRRRPRLGHVRPALF